MYNNMMCYNSGFLLCNVIVAFGFQVMLAYGQQEEMKNGYPKR